MSKLICPNCGSEVVLPETSSLVMGMSMSKQGDDVHYLNMEKKGNNTMGIIENTICNGTVNNNNKEKTTMLDSRINTLTNNGIDTSKYFSFQLPNGKVIKVDENGDLVNDEIGKQIEKDGYLSNKTLYRRWVMAQFFRMYNSPKGIHDSVADMSLKYQWDMLDDELDTLAKLEEKDSEYFAERQTFFTREVVAKICEDYLEEFQEYIDELPTKKCKGVPYKKIIKQNIFVVDIEKKIFRERREIIRKMYRAKSYKELLRMYHLFLRKSNKYCRNNGKVSKTWIDAYKGAGAYYTLQNMVLYHGCKLNTYPTSYKSLLDKNRGCLYGDKAYEYMKSLLNDYDNYKWVGMFRQCVKDNNFTFGK